MAAPSITLYVDTVSPFAYMAYYLLRGGIWSVDSISRLFEPRQKFGLMINKHDPVFSTCEFTFVPIFLGGLIKACNNIAPLHVKNKDKWVRVERIRWSRYFNIPMQEEAPDDFPPLTLPVMRALCAITVLHPGREGQIPLINALDELFKEYWVNHNKTTDKDVLSRVLSNVLGKEEAAKVLVMAGKEGKETLAKNTDKAFADGAFGLPWFVATNSKGETETFWGVDHLGQVTEHLGIEKPATRKWKALL